MAAEDTTTSVERALSILELVAQKEGGLTNSEISRQLSIPKSSASYLLRTLEGRGYLRRDVDSGQYEIGVKLLGLVQHVMVGLDVTRVARPFLLELVEETRLTAHLAILDRGRAVYIDRAENPGFIKINTWVGRELPIHSTSVGKALVADMDLHELNALLDRDGLERRTHKTITARRDFLAELQRVREQGFAVDDEENNLGVRCVAAAIRDGEGRVRAALGASGTTTLFPPDSIPRVARLVRGYADEIARQLGARQIAR